MTKDGPQFALVEVSPCHISSLSNGYRPMIPSNDIRNAYYKIARSANISISIDRIDYQCQTITLDLHLNRSQCMTV